jgi:hypothetical protein
MRERLLLGAAGGSADDGGGAGADVNTSAKVPMNSARSLGASEFDILNSKR